MSKKLFKIEFFNIFRSLFPSLVIKPLNVQNKRESYEREEVFSQLQLVEKFCESKHFCFVLDQTQWWNNTLKICLTFFYFRLWNI